MKLPFVDFLWNSTLTLLLCFFVLSLLVYKAGKDKVFFYYGAYLFFLMLYVVSRASIFSSIQDNELVLTFRRVFNWYIQIIYHYIHILFALLLVGVQSKYPKLYKTVKLYAKTSLSLGTFLAFLTVVGVLKTSHFDFYFVYLHIPIFILFGIFVLRKAWQESNFVISCFFWGTVIYAVLAAAALSLTVMFKSEKYELLIAPMVIFYVGVIAETIAFAMGLGYRIKGVYDEKLQFQKDLNHTNLLLQKELEEKINFQSKENAALIKLNEKQELETKLAQLTNKVFRSQMNSHFIFNVLNSIKTFIIDNKEKDAVNYLNKFSKFIRKVLDSNFYEENSLSDELDTLKLYLDIESIRLQHNFTYKIAVENFVDIDSIKFPALLLQPFVENAIWHGLMPKEGDKNLLIKVSNANENQKNCVKITIDDNGIGMKKSIEKRKTNLKHKSVGMSIVNERIKEFNKNKNAQISTKIFDKDEIGETGTFVELMIENQI